LSKNFKGGILQNKDNLSKLITREEVDKILLDKEFLFLYKKDFYSSK